MIVIKILRLAPQQHRFVVVAVVHRRRHPAVRLLSAAVPVAALPAAAALRLGPEPGGPVWLVGGGCSRCGRVPWHVVRGGRHNDRVLVAVVVLRIGDVEVVVPGHAHDAAAVGAARKFHRRRRPVGIFRHRGS